MIRDDKLRKVLLGKLNLSGGGRVDADPCGLCKFTIKIGINVGLRNILPSLFFDC